MKDVVTIKEVAEHLQVCEKTVRGWVRDGILPVLAPCRDIRIRRLDIEGLFKSKTKQKNKNTEE